MYALDFEYGDFSTGLDNDKAKLSDFGFIICQFDATGGANIASAGSTITFNKTPINYGKRFDLVSTSYEECLETTFDICKNPDIYEYKDMEISDQEKRNLIVWLSRHKFMDFKLIKEDSSIKDVFYKASFNVEEIWISGKLYGLRLNLTTDKPYGYGAPVEFSYIDVVRQSPVYINLKKVDSDEIGYIPLKIRLTSKVNGTINIKSNVATDYEITTEIKNCQEGEIITIDSENQIISSNSDTHKIYNDFNFSFPKIARYWKKNNEYGGNLQLRLISSTYPYTAAGTVVGDITFSYTPIIKGSIS